MVVLMSELLNQFENDIDVVLFKASDEVSFVQASIEQEDEITAWLTDHDFEIHTTFTRAFILFMDQDTCIVVCWDKVMFDKLKLAAKICNESSEPLSEERRMNVFRTVFRNC